MRERRAYLLARVIVVHSVLFLEERRNCFHSSLALRTHPKAGLTLACQGYDQSLQEARPTASSLSETKKTIHIYSLIVLVTDSFNFVTREVEGKHPAYLLIMYVSR
ncbi:hypothetical protein NDU88_003314 [Pleurodeles waltl]|uniref:Secreted protein n=1 Tax=Pleurodeles waltl TaxID=8319 RepID=A0AAV7UFU7_PLEWA|nr:hypothetical protein NDU88_003314 [Pleurodeles waltl]